MALRMVDVLRVILQSGFEPIPATLLAGVPARSTRARVDCVNQHLNQLGFQILLYKRAKTNYILLTDMSDEAVLTSDDAITPTPAPEPTEPFPTADAMQLAAETDNDQEETPDEQQPALRPLAFPGEARSVPWATGRERVQNPLLPIYETVRAVLLYFQHETDLEQLVHFLAANSNPFCCETVSQSQDRWRETLQNFVDRGMLGQRKVGQLSMISDAGGENFIKNADMIMLLNSAGTNFDVERELERYKEISDIYRKDAVG